MKPLEWLLMAVESAVLIVGLLHIYLFVGKESKEKKPMFSVLYVFVNKSKGVRELDARNKKR